VRSVSEVNVGIQRAGDVDFIGVREDGRVVRGGAQVYKDGVAGFEICRLSSLGDGGWFGNGADDA
jgi:hypothetical protein